MKESDTTTVIYGVSEHQPSQTHGDINIAKSILGAVVTKSDTTTAMCDVFENLPAKTHTVTINNQ